MEGEWVAHLTHHTEPSSFRRDTAERRYRAMILSLDNVLRLRGEERSSTQDVQLRSPLRGTSQDEMAFCVRGAGNSPLID